MKENVFIIAEAGVNHNGNFDLALKLCDVAKESGADAVKFQTFKTENIITKNALLAEYQKENIGSNISQFEMLKGLELSYNHFIQIKQYCERIGILFLSTPDDEESLDFLCSLSINPIKIGSGEVTNIPYLRKIAQKKCDVILSTGMSNMQEVKIAFENLTKYGAKSISLLHCTSNYPCPINEVNLNAMVTLKKEFNVIVGYSDHTLGIELPIAATALGAKIIEKHITLDNTMDGPDHKASLNPVDFRKMVLLVRNIELALGTGVKIPNQSELEIRKLVQKSIVARKNIYKGEILTEENITVKRASNGISASEWDNVLGKVAITNYDIDDVIIKFID